jgi:putative FmdB family regulatory protein
MPIYTYRREDGTTFEIRQKFSDDPLELDPETGQTVNRVIHSAGVIFKGSGYYVTDNRNANNPAAPKSNGNGNDKGSTTSSDSSASNGTSTNASSDSSTKADVSTSTSPAAAD